MHGCGFVHDPASAADIARRHRPRRLVGCVPPDERQRGRVPPDYSRLASAFPPGSPQTALIDSLVGQGFVLSGECKADSTIRIASFHANGRGFIAYATNAQAYWQVDTDGRIVWTKGFVSYTGL
jgi:hypothetical protein